MNRVGALLCTALVLASPRVAAAPSAVATEARQHFKRGTTLYEEGDYRAALVEFQRANEILPNPIVLFNVGQAQYQLGEYVNALKSLQQYLEVKDPSGASRRVLALKEIEELKQRVTPIEIQTSVPGAEIAIDDQVIGTAPQTTLVAVGRRRITATLAGYKSAMKLVDIASGSTSPIVLDLAPEHAEPPPPPPPVEPPPPPKRTNPLVYGTFGVGAAGLVAGTVFGALAISAKSSLEESCPDASACPPSAREHKDALESRGAISTIGFVVAGIGAGAGLFLLLTGRGTMSSRVHVGQGLRVTF